MAKGILSKVVSALIWIAGILVSLAVGFGMIGGTLSLPVWLGGATSAMIAGWIVVVLTFLGVILALFDI